VRHASSTKADDVNKTLMEFFDAKNNWGENEVKHGRSWQLPELRIKSNTDLHKIWYILLKEKNMLLTMEHECREEHRLFPSPERLEKVKESMSNLESVVRERNTAYHKLETGEHGERPGKLVNNQLGIKFYYRSFEHVIPHWMNVKWRESHNFRFGGYAVRKFLLKYREKLWNEKRKSKNRDRNEVVHMLKRNPELSKDMLQQKYPDVNIDRLVKLDKARGHFVPKLD
jgi:large subunit ribosomal protein L47